MCVSVGNKTKHTRSLPGMDLTGSMLDWNHRHGIPSQLQHGNQLHLVWGHTKVLVCAPHNPECPASAQYRCKQSAVARTRRIRSRQAYKYK